MSRGSTKAKVVFLHPDLGIGGAERLIIDASVALKEQNYDVTIYTGYYDESRAFAETKDGTVDVVPVGQWIPRSIGGSFVAFMAYLKMMYMATSVNFWNTFSKDAIDLFICDQVPVAIPIIKFLRLLRLRSSKVMFYCHYPDKLLCTDRASIWKKIYRLPLDLVEEFSIDLADKIVVNSEFTRGVFHSSFRYLQKSPSVLYPSINTEMFDEKLKTPRPQLPIPEVKYLLLSLNRFESKKAVDLAIFALKKLKSCLDPEEWNEVHLVIAGGYDPRLVDNVRYLDELKSIANDENVADHVTFRLSPSDLEKVHLLNECCMLLYTPSEEHFGIVPLEAMYMEKPVIAVDSGGPKETVVHGTTGCLCPSIPSNFAASIALLIKNDALRKQFGIAGQKRFYKRFSFQAFSQEWQNCVLDLIGLSK